MVLVPWPWVAPGRRSVRPALLLVALLAAGSWRAGADVDWRSKGAVTPVKNEGSAGCGLSWAFATTGAIEGAYTIEAGTLKNLSEQQLVDCAASCGGSSAVQCPAGGCPQLGCVFEFVSSHGLCAQSSYPFTGRPGSCRTTCAPVVPSGFATNWVRVTPGDETALRAAIDRGPVLARLEIGNNGSPLPEYVSYGHGIFPPVAYDATVVQWVLIVGYDTTNDDYIVKNSLGTSWGVGGYLFLPFGTNALGLTDFAYSLQPGLPATNGACFASGGSCLEVDATTCRASDGTFSGTGSFCPTACPAAVAIASVPTFSHRGLTGLALLLAATGVAALLRYRRSGS